MDRVEANRLIHAVENLSKSFEKFAKTTNAAAQRVAASTEPLRKGQTSHPYLKPSEPEISNVVPNGVTIPVTLDWTAAPIHGNALFISENGHLRCEIAFDDADFEKVTNLLSIMEVEHMQLSVVNPE